MKITLLYGVSLKLWQFLVCTFPCILKKYQDSLDALEEATEGQCYTVKTRYTECSLNTWKTKKASFRVKTNESKNVTTHPGFS